MKEFFAKIKNFIVSHKVWSSVIAGVLALSILAGIFLPNMQFFSTNGGLTRADWVEMLKSNFGVAYYDTTEPFFSDVKSDDALFAPAQALKEREIIDYEKTFDRDKKVTFGEMLTHVSKLYGESYIERRLEKENATETELKDYIRKQTPISDAYADSKVLTVEQATEWMNAIHEKYLDREFGNSYSAVYKEKVREMFDETQYTVNEDTLTFTTDKDIAAGDILILGANNEHISGIVRKVDEVVDHEEDTYTLTVSEPALEEVIEEIDFEFSKSLEMGEFVPAEGITVVENRESQEEGAGGEVELNISPMLFSSDVQVTPLVQKTSDKPNVITVDKDDNDFSHIKSGTFFDRSVTCPSDLIKLNPDFPGSKGSNSNDNYADSFFVDKNGKLKSKYDAGYEAELGLKLSDFELKGSLDYKGVIYLSAFTVNASLDVTPYFAIRGNASTTIKIGHIPCNIGYGFAAEIDINLVISIDGEISVQPTIKCEASVSKGYSTYCISGTGKTDTDTEVNVNGNLNVSVGPDVTLSWCSFAKIVDVYAYIGVGASSNYTTKKPDVITTSIYLPTLHVGVGENENTLLSIAVDEKMDLAIFDNNGGLNKCFLTYTKEFKLIKVEPMSWSFKDGVLTISGGGRMPDYMGQNASETLPPWFRGTQEGTPDEVNTEIKKIVIEDGITYIGAGAFGSLSVEEVVMADTVAEIGENAFAGCEELTKVKFSEGLDKIGDGAFYYCTKLDNIKLPSACLRLIKRNSFKYCDSLRSITIPACVDIVDAWSFTDCPNLETVIIESPNTHVHDSAFNRTKYQPEEKIETVAPDYQ